MDLSNITYVQPVEDGAYRADKGRAISDTWRDSNNNRVNKHADHAANWPTKSAPWLVVSLLLGFLAIGPLLQLLDPQAGVLDIGILSLLFFGLMGGVLAVFCCFWLQELLWRPFKFFREEFQSHFNQLTSWQQCILYFSVFFLSLYAVLWVLGMVF